MAVEHDPSAAYDDLNVRSIALVAGVGAVLVFVAIVAVQVIYFRYNDQEYEEKVLAIPTRQANETLLAQWDRIADPAPGATAENGAKLIPIEQAMADVVAEYQQRQEARGESPAEEAAVDTPTNPEKTPAEAVQPAAE